MDIPASIKKKASKAGVLYEGLRHAFAAADPIVRDGPLPLFPEYTDHGPRHIAAVIDSACSLVAQPKTFSPQDAGALGLAALLHDIAMHVTADGFQSLTAPGSRWTVPGWDERPWHALWADFLIEARRFDERTMKRLFGRVLPVGEPDADPLLWTEADRMLAGEFLRRHHPRLAHEIALHGFPADGGEAVALLPPAFNGKLAGLVGLIARSHGLALRDAVERLKQVDSGYHRKAFDIQTTYLMALLRLADYMQIQPERAPTGLTALRRLRSTVSQVEWRTHACVEDVAEDVEDDPACLLIRATPPDMTVYLRLRGWLDGIQHELDQAWAVLGEVYGRFPKPPALTLRRIKSSIDDIDRLSSAIAFHPQACRFTAADGPLLRLLVGPLYGWKQEIGIRELLQNAVDAVRQRKFLCDHQPGIESLPADGGTDVDIHMDYDGGVLPVAVIVRDRGIGMTADTIRDFFLRAGATYRQSADWQGRYCDENGGAKVEKAGRFGVGALAAFLLGNRIAVTTRHAEAGADGGLCFEAGLEDDLIEIRKVAGDIPVGTTIRVFDLVDAKRLAEEVDYGRNGWRRWTLYALPWPKVVVRNGDNVIAQEEIVDDRWVVVPQPDFPELRVKYWPKSTAFYCSGIKVGSGPEPLKFEPNGFEWPRVAVSDPGGLLPLSLDRNRVTGDLPFEPQVSRGVVRHLAARALRFGPTDERLDDRFLIDAFPVWCLNGRGEFLPSDPTLLHRVEICRMYLSSRVNKYCLAELKEEACWAYLERDFFHSELRSQFLRFFPPEAAVALQPSKNLKWRRYEDFSCGRGLWSKSPSSRRDTRMMRLLDAEAGAGREGTSMVCCGVEIKGASPRFADLWAEIVPGLVIPLDEAERRTKLAAVYADLAEEIAYYDAVPEDQLPRRLRGF